ncbi:MAG: DUF427 domain-containing protein [Chromatiales bacterium]|jgi:uncharacterized protein (DUF427 family)|nr:DUF427 domain-containing protein [Chromatiales bacterium]
MATTQSEHGFERQPGFPISFHPANKRIRVTFAGATVVDSVRAMVMDEDGHQPVYYFAPDEIQMALLGRTPHSSR